MKRSFVLLLVAGATFSAMILGCDGKSEPPRTLVTRSLLGTSVQSVLLDPFTTPDLSWGHFLPFDVVSASNAPLVAIAHDTVSQSPAGVTVPVAHLASLDETQAGGGTLEVLAPFSGGTAAMAASVWVAVTDRDDNPVGLATIAAPEIAILPNDQPSASYPLVAGAPQVIAGQEWTPFALAGMPLPDGAWFSIVMSDTSHHLLVQAPEVYPLGATTAARPARSPRRADASATMARYIELIKHAPHPRAR